MRGAAATCQGCPLYQDATQTVFGQGAVPAAGVATWHPSAVLRASRDPEQARPSGPKR